MIPVAVSFITGIAAFHFFPFFPLSIIILLICALFLLSFLKLNTRIILILVIVFGLGLSYTYLRHDNRAESDFYRYFHSESLAGSALVEGTVSDLLEVSDGKMRFTIKDVEINGRKLNGKVRLFINEDVYGYGHYRPDYGDRISAAVHLREPAALKNPGLYSYDLKRDGIFAVGYISGFRLTGKGKGLSVWISQKRQRLGDIIDNSLSEENASLHKAIIPGIKRGIGQSMREAFSTTGLAHLLSISGTHFGLLAFIIFKFVKMMVKLLPGHVLAWTTLFLTPTQVAVILTMPVLIMYAVMSGASTPTVRSFIMVFIYMSALFLGRRGEWLNSLSIAAVIILLWNPEALFGLSFQLSFLAVFSIGYVLERSKEDEVQNEEDKKKNTDFRNFIMKPAGKTGAAMLITIAAVLGTAPIVVLFFHQFPLISPVTNIIVTPLICFLVLPLGFFSGFSALLFNMDTMPLNGLIGSLTHFTLLLIKLFSKIPYSSLHLPNPSFILIILYFLSLFYLVRGKSISRFIPLMIVICLYITRPYMNNGDFRVTFLDVGQGDSSVIETPDNRVMLIDGGPESNDSGRRVIAPFLWSKGIMNIDYLVVSHPHLDHYGGLSYILDNFDVVEVWYNGRVINGSKTFFRKIIEKGIPLKRLQRGDVMEAEGYRISVLHPYYEFYADSLRGDFSNENSDSLVLKVEAGDLSVLFAGDVEDEAEWNLTHLGQWIRSDILKVPHHGGRTSSSEVFMRSVGPETAVISSGRYNSFRHPHEETLKRYKDAGVRLFRTDRNGAVIVVSDKEGYDVRAYSDFEFKEVKGLRDELSNLKLLL